MDRGDNILLGVAGDPVLHSRSPQMFREIFLNSGLNGAYVRCVVKNAAEAVRLINELGFNGMNITAPFKEKVIPFLNTVSDDAESIGAVNTITQSDGTLTGYNTDHYGVTEPIEKRIGKIAGKRCLILGAGGAGIAAAYGLKQKGAEVIILNKFEEQGNAAALKTGAEFEKLEFLPYQINQADIIINTIPYEIGALDISGIRSNSLFFDAGYKKSHYNAAVEKAGASFIGGEEWLIHQGIHACRHFLGFLPDKEILSSALERAVSDKSIISFSGFMATGKSSAGRMLADKLGYEFADTDEIIEMKQSMSIADIFKNYGEEKFRDMESDTLLSFKGRKKLVISCGGGAVLKEINRDFLTEETVPFWLYTSMEETLKRGNDGTRPLLNNMESPGQLMELFEKRKHLYASLYGTLVISEGSPEQIMELIHEEIRLSL